MESVFKMKAIKQFIFAASGWKINPVMGAMYAPELYTGEFPAQKLPVLYVSLMLEFILFSLPVLFFPLVASFPYPVATPTLAYRGSALRGRGRAVYNTIRSAAATPATAVPAYPG